MAQLPVSPPVVVVPVVPVVVEAVSTLPPMLVVEVTLGEPVELAPPTLVPVLAVVVTVPVLPGMPVTGAGSLAEQPHGAARNEHR